MPATIAGHQTTEAPAGTAARSFRSRVEALVDLSEPIGSNANAISSKSSHPTKVAGSNSDDQTTHAAARRRHSASHALTEKEARKADRRNLPEALPINTLPNAPVLAVATGQGVQAEPQRTSTAGKDDPRVSLSIPSLFTSDAQLDGVNLPEDKMPGPTSFDPLPAAKLEAQVVRPVPVDSLSNESLPDAITSVQAQNVITEPAQAETRIAAPREGASVASDVLSGKRSISAAAEPTNALTETMRSSTRATQLSSTESSVAYQSSLAEPTHITRPVSAPSGLRKDAALTGPAAQPNAGTQPAYSFIQSPFAAHESTVEQSGARAGNLSSGDLTSALRQTFTTMDSTVSARTASSMHAERGSVEAGFDDPALGWIGVRAELGHSGIHASVVPDSTSAEESLRAHLSGLSDYLAERHAPIETLTVTASAGQSIAQWSGDAHKQGSEGQSAGQHGREDTQGKGSGGDRGTAKSDSAPDTRSSFTSRASTSTASSPWFDSSGGRSISLIA